MQHIQFKLVKLRICIKDFYFVFLPVRIKTLFKRIKEDVFMGGLCSNFQIHDFRHVFWREKFFRKGKWQ